jgi:hypothetical protein
MPYELYQSKGKWCVRNRETGENKGCSDSKEKAFAHQRVLNAVDHGRKPTGKKRN